jgi:hypothetical protein
VVADRDVAHRCKCDDERRQRTREALAVEGTTDGFAEQLMTRTRSTREGFAARGFARFALLAFFIAAEFADVGLRPGARAPGMIRHDGIQRRRRQRRRIDALKWCGPMTATDAAQQRRPVTIESEASAAIPTGAGIANVHKQHADLLGGEADAWSAGLKREANARQTAPIARTFTGSAGVQCGIVLSG